jgi:hypothetical protein
MRPPRTANSPGSRTVPVRLKPCAARKAVNFSRSSVPPRWNDSVAPAKTGRGGTRCRIALTVVMTMGPGPCRGFALASLASTLARSAMISTLGETRS